MQRLALDLGINLLTSLCRPWESGDVQVIHALCFFRTEDEVDHPSFFFAWSWQIGVRHTPGICCRRRGMLAVNWHELIA